MLVEIEILPTGSADDKDTVKELTRLINSGYEAGEAGLWSPGAARTDDAEITDLIRRAQLAAARLADAIVGSVRVQQIDARTAEFGMLVADPAHRGVSIGRRLVEFAENWARQRGLATMQLEVLKPREWDHPSKVFLLQWYQRLGYRQVRSAALEEAYPALAPQLATPCDFVIYRKELADRRHGTERRG